MHPETYGIQTAYLELWDRFIETYTRGSDIPATYYSDLYPWIGDLDALNKKLSTICTKTPYDAATQHFLDMVLVYAKPLNPGNTTTQPLARLPYATDIRYRGSDTHIDAYIKLDTFLSSLNLIMSAWRVANSRPNHIDFLDNTHHRSLFGHLGTYMRDRDNLAGA